MPQDNSNGKRPGLMVAIGIGKPKGAGPTAPWDKGPAAGGPDDGDSDQDDTAGGGQQKVTPEDAHCFTGDYRCVACEHYIHAGHECTKVEGNNFGTEIVGCVDYWEPQGSAQGVSPDSGVAASGPQGDFNPSGPNSTAGY